MNFLSSQTRVERLPSPGILPRDDDLVELLKSSDFDTRLQTLNRAMSLSKRDAGWFTRFQRKGDLFKSLDRILTDDRWEVQHQCIKFLTESLPVFGNSLEYCMCYVMPNIITKLGSSKITVRKASIQLIQTYLKLQPIALGSLQKMISNYLLTSKEDKTIKSEILSEIPSIFIPEVSQSSWVVLLDTLLSFNPQSDKDMEVLADVMNKLRVFIGREQFSQHLQSLSDSQKKKFQGYENLMKNFEKKEEGPPIQTTGRISAKYGQERRFRFGIVPIFISAMITDEDATQRISGLEKLKQIMEKIMPEELQRLVPHLHSYLMTIGHVLSDLNFKVVVLSLDVLRLTVNRLKTNIEVHLQQVVSLLSKHFGNQKAVIKQLIMMTCMDLFQNLPPKAVVGSLSVFLENRNSRIREEVVNILTSALMIISATKLNFTVIINILIPMLLDSKRRVRLAAFEQVSVVAYLMNGKHDQLYRAVREAEEKHSIVGLSAAIQARIRRHLLPRIRYDGLIEYSTPPVSDNSFNIDEDQLGMEDNIDLHFILYGGGGDNHERSSLNISASVITEDSKRNKILPWEKEDEVICASPNIRSDESSFKSTECNLNASSNSWHAPTRRKISLTLEDRAASAALEQKRQSVQKETFGKSRSVSNIGDEVENQPPKSLNEIDTKSDYGNSVYNQGRSMSQNSLNIASSQGSVKSTLSTPAKKTNSFLKSGAGNRAKTVVKHQSEGKSPISKTQIKQSPENALTMINTEDWSQKVDGLQQISSIAQTNPAALEKNIKEIIKVVIFECKNLRSSVSRVALTCLGDLFEGLKTKVDGELEKTCAILLNKTGDVSNAFIRDDASTALIKVITYASPYKALNAIILAGSKSKNNTIRASCALFVHKLISRVGTTQFLNNTEQLINVIPNIISFAKDQNPQVRNHGKQSLQELSQNTNFDKSMKKSITDDKYRELKEIIETSMKKGHVDKESNNGFARNGSSKKSPGFRKLKDSEEHDLEECRNQLISSEWETRMQGLSAFATLFQSSSKAAASDTKLNEAFIGRLSDINSKVSLVAMNTFLKILPLISKFFSTESNLKAVYNQMVLSLMVHLSSKSEEHRNQAIQCLKSSIELLDLPSISIAIAESAKKANVKQKPFLIFLLTDVCKKLYYSKPKQVELIALPLLWTHLQSYPVDHEHRQIVNQFANTLSSLIGKHSLIDMASTKLSADSKKLLHSILDK